jgi:hypothetical protein
MNMSVQLHVLSDLRLRGLCAPQMEDWLSSIMLWRRRRYLASAENGIRIVQSSSPKLAWGPVEGVLHRGILTGMEKTIGSNPVIWWRHYKRRWDLSVLTTVAEENWFLGCDVMSCGKNWRRFRSNLLPSSSGHIFWVRRLEIPAHAI